MIIKAKFEAIESGITTFEEEFLAKLMIPGGRTLGEAIIPQMDEVCRLGKLPPLLPGVS